LGGQRGRVDDVGEQQRRQHPIRVGLCAGAGEELFDLIQQAVDPLGERQMIGARQLDEPRALDRRRGQPAQLRMRHGEQRGDNGAVVQADLRGPVRPRGLEHGHGVAYLRLQVGKLMERHRVGQPRAPSVEVDQPTERAQARAPSRRP